MLRFTSCGTPQRTPDDWRSFFSERAADGFFYIEGKPFWPHDPWGSSINCCNLAKIVNGQVVLDLGCGPGRLAVSLANRQVAYVGIDCCKEAIDFARTLFAPYPHLKFLHSDIYAEVYNPSGKLKDRDFTIPYPDETFDCVTAYSFFTHVDYPHPTTHYINESWRCLKPGGLFVATWCITGPRQSSSHDVRCIIVDPDEVLETLGKFKIESEAPRLEEPYYQWCVTARK